MTVFVLVYDTRFYLIQNVLGPKLVQIFWHCFL